MSLISLFRVGKPRVTETTNQFDCGRSTGGLGTGIYAYQDLNVAKEHSLHMESKQKVYELPNICKKPLILREALYGSEKYTELFNKAGISMRCEDVGAATNRFSWIPEIMNAVSKKTNCGKSDSKECANELEKIVISSIQKEKDCRTDKTGKLDYGSKYCSQAMNHVLNDLEFDCVLPTDKAGGNKNYYGSVILKETVDKKLGRKTVGYEDIEDFGKKL